MPGHIIPIIEREFDDFDNEAEQFLAGQLEENQFIGFRLKQGVYGQRQPDVQMIRIKLPLGGVTPEQMEPSPASSRNTRRSTRATSRPARTSRSTTCRCATPSCCCARSPSPGSPRARAAATRSATSPATPGPASPPTRSSTRPPYAGAYVRYFVRHPTTQLMPRKIKTSFTGSDADRAISGIHDIAFLARERDGVKGFEVRVGGGTSIMARVAPTLYEFVEADNGDYLKVAEAVLRIFDRQEWLRVNRARARIKVLVDKIGMDAFREQVDDELEGDWVAEREFDAELVERLRYDDDEEANAPAEPAAADSPNGDRTEFERFVEGNVQAQRQEGFSTVEVKITRGDLTPEQFRGLAAIMREYTGGYARSTVQQNFVLRWVRDGALYDVWQRLTELGLGEAGPREITDVVSCPGTDSCKLGITSSMGLNRAIKERVEEMEITDALTKQIHIKMSGCPNGCSQHHIANIGFYGASLKVGGRQMPAYIPHIAGNYVGGEIVFGTRLKSRLPAKRVPEAVERWIRLYEGERDEGEEFNAFAERIGAERFEAEVKELTLPAEFSLETMQQFIDWNRSSPYKVERGEGECAI